MVAFYLMRIKAGKMTLNQVPPKWYDKVDSQFSK